MYIALPKTNYEVFASIWINESKMRRFETALSIAPGSSFIKPDQLAHWLRDKIESLGDDVTVSNTSGRPVYFLSSIVLMVQPCNSFKNVRFFVADKLATVVILGCDYCALCVDAERPLLKIFRIDDGSTVPIIRQASPIKTELPFPK